MTYMNEKEVSLFKIWTIVVDFMQYMGSKKKPLLIFLIAGISCGILASVILKPNYKSELTFVLENSGKSKLGGYSGLAAQFGLNLFDGGGMFQDEDNIIALIQSRSIITRTLLTPITNSNQLLLSRYLDTKGYSKKWKRDKLLSKLDFSGTRTRLQDSVLGLAYKEILKKHLVVTKPDRKLDIVSVTTTDNDELFAKEFTERLVENVAKFYVEVQTKKSHENVGILRHQVDSVRQLLNDAISGVAISAEANPNLNPALQRLRVPSQRMLVDVEMNKAILTELVKNLELAEISLRKETPLFQTIDRPVLPLEKKELTLLKGCFIGFISGLFAALVIIGFQFLKLSDVNDRKQRHL